jgi:hypothetical protein
MPQKTETYFKLLAVVAMLCSALYEFMYFQGFGLSIRDVPINTADLVKGWAEWGTYGGGILLGIFINELVIARVEGWKTEDEIVSSSSNPQRLKNFRASPYKLVYWLGLLLLVAFLFIGEAAAIPTMLGFIVVSTIFIKWLIEGSLYESIFYEKRIPIFIVANIGFAVLGFSNGSNAMNSSFSLDAPTMTVENGEAVKVIRIFDQWTLVRTEGKQFGWVNNQSNKVIKFNTDRYQFIGLACYLKKNYDFAKFMGFTHCKYTYNLNVK